MTRKVTVSLGATICTDPENRQFLRVAIEAHEVDIDGDIAAQMNDYVAAAMEITHRLDDGLKESVTEVIVGGETPGLVRDALAAHDEKFIRMGRAWRGAMDRIAELEDSIKKMVEGEPDEAEESKETPE